MECIRLDQCTVQIHLTEQLFEDRPLMVLAGGVAGALHRCFGYQPNVVASMPGAGGGHAERGSG